MQEIDNSRDYDFEDETAEAAEAEDFIASELPVSDEPVEVSPDEIAPDEVVVVASEDALEDKGHLTELVCECCLELNLITKSCITCSRCGAAFCLHFASAIDAQYCVNCFSDMAVTKEVIVKTYEHKNSETGDTQFYRRKARAIKLTGLDWLFSQRKIIELTDAELDLSIEYHRNILNLMLAEQERRRNEKIHRYANVVYKPVKSAVNVTETTTTTVKKTRTVSKDKTSEQLQAIMKSMLAKGFTQEQLKAMLKK